MAEGTERDEAEQPAEDERGSRTRSYEESVAGRSDVDAMGNDKRRQVIGGQYGASVRKRLIVYGVAVGVVIALIIVSLTVVSNVDNKEIALEPTAPWANADAEQVVPRDVDFPRNGPPQAAQGDNIGGDATIDPSEIFNR
jgi:hypothetical protein